MENRFQEKSPVLDTSLGLIFRLNGLWADVDRHAKNGQYQDWNITLDRIWANLDFDTKFDVKKDENGSVISVSLDSEDDKIYRYLSRQIWLAQENFKKRKIRLNVSRWYQAIYKKDRWLRKLMMKLKLYLKQTTHDSTTAMFGEGF